MEKKFLQVSYDSKLGHDIKDYMTYCEQANQVAADLILALGEKHPKLGFPTLTKEQAAEISYESNDNYEAGGFVAITIPEQILAQLNIDYDLWAKFDMDKGPRAVDENGNKLVFLSPRVSIVDAQWMLYRDALLQSRYPEWQFDVESNEKSQFFGKPLFYRFEKVKNRILPDNMKELNARARGRKISDATKVSIGIKFGFKSDAHINADGVKESIAFNISGDYEEKLLLGRELYQLIKSLPLVNVGTLERMIGLHRPKDAPRAFHPLLAYKDDSENHRFIITTNLETDNEDVVPVMHLSQSDNN